MKEGIDYEGGGRRRVRRLIANLLKTHLGDPNKNGPPVFPITPGGQGDNTQRTRGPRFSERKGCSVYGEKQSFHGGKGKDKEESTRCEKERR